MCDRANMSFAFICIRVFSITIRTLVRMHGWPIRRVIIYIVPRPVGTPFLPSKVMRVQTPDFHR